MSVNISPPTELNLSRRPWHTFDEAVISGPYTIEFDATERNSSNQSQEGRLRIKFSNAGPVTFLNPDTNLPLDHTSEYLLRGDSRFEFLVMVDHTVLNEGTEPYDKTFIDPTPYIRMIEETQLIEWFELSFHQPNLQDPNHGIVPWPGGGANADIRVYMRHVQRRFDENGEDLGFWGTTYWPGGDVGFVVSPATFEDERAMFNNGLIHLCTAEGSDSAPNQGDQNHGKITFTRNVRQTQRQLWQRDQDGIHGRDTGEGHGVDYSGFDHDPNPLDSGQEINFIVRPYNSPQFLDVNGNELQLPMQLSNMY